MTKLFSGSTISYGKRLPAPNSASDGAFFYLTDGYTDQFGVPRSPGLFLYSFQQDISGTVGDQVGLGWTQVTTSGASFLSTGGGTLTGNVSGTAFRAAQGAPNDVDGSTNGYGFGTDGDSGLFSVGTGNMGTSVSVYLNDAERLKITSTDVTIGGGTVVTSLAGVAYDSARLGSNGASYYLNLDNFSTGTIDINGRTNSTLNVSRGGTGLTSTTSGGVMYGGVGSIGFTAAGASGQFLQSNGTSAPAWVSLQLLPPPGTGNVVFSNGAGYTLVGSGADNQILTLVGGVPSWAAAPSVGSVGQLSTPRNITISGDATGSILLTMGPSTIGFDGSGDVSISVNVTDSERIGGFLSDVAANGSTAAIRDAAGDLEVHRINVTQPMETISFIGGIGAFFVSTATDGFSRRVSRAEVLGDLGTAFVPLGGTGASPITGAVVSNSTITATGFTTPLGDISAGQTGNGFGAVLMRKGGSSSFTGGVEFYGNNGVLSARIGYADQVGSSNTGTLPYVAGSHAFTGPITCDNNITAYSSDGRLKKNVKVITNAVEKVRSLGGYSYDWDLEKCEAVGFKPEREHEHGLIAQEVQGVIPDAVAPAPFNNEFLTVRYERLIALLTAAISEQQTQIDALRRQVATLVD